VSLEARGVPGLPVHDVREAAKRQARTISAGLVAIAGAGLAILLVIGFVLLDYQFNQASHRLFKILAGGMGATAILLWPRFGFWLIPIAVPFLSLLPKSPVPGVNTLNGLLLSVFLTWAFARVLARQPLLRPARLGPWIGAFLLLAVLSIVRGAAFPTGYDYSAAATGLQLFRAGVSFLAYFIALSMAKGERDRRLYAFAIVLGLLAEAVVTIMWGGNGRGGRAVGSIGQANELGAFLAVYTAVAAALIWGVKSIPVRLLLAATVVAGAWAVLLTVSRGAIVALAAALIFVAMRSSRWMTVLVVVALLTSPVWAPQNVKDRVMSTQEEVEGSDEVELEASAQARVETWQTIMRIISEHPLEGVGFGGLGYVLQETGAEMGLYIVKDSAHNTFLRMWGEMGILGVVVFIGLLIACLRLALDGARVAANRFDRQLSIGLAAAVLALGISCAFGDRFFRFEIVGSFWMLCALVNDLWLERREARP
jgi:O-antigen ligase